jgi:hypothetical protein
MKAMAMKVPAPTPTNRPCFKPFGVFAPAMQPPMRIEKEKISPVSRWYCWSSLTLR